MEMPKFKLTKTAVESQTPQAKDIILHDTEVKGFQAKITPAGRRSYQVYYRTKDGRERRPKIGDHGIFTVQQFRVSNNLQQLLVNPFGLKIIYFSINRLGSVGA